MEERIKKAVELFKAGYNCSQAVLTAFADIYEIPEEVALRIAAPFGGGIGRMRETCGAACGLFLLAGLENGSVVPGDKVGKTANYGLVQELAGEFRRRNGSLCCRELLGLLELTSFSPVPDERTDPYYATRPCEKIVEEAVKIWVESLEKHKKRS